MWARIAKLLPFRRKDNQYIDDLVNNRSSDGFSISESYASHRGSRILGGPDPIEHAILVCVDMRLAIWLNQITAEELAVQALEFTNTLKDSDQRKYISVRQVLIELVEIMAFQKVNNRSVARDVLTVLFKSRGFVPHNLYFPTRTERESVTHRIMRDYVIKMVAGWKLDTNDEKPKWPETNYLDIPIGDTSEMFRSHSLPLGTALYRLHDLDLVLKFLRHGAYPSMLILWPYALRLFPSTLNEEVVKRVQAASSRILMLWSICRLNFQVELLDRSQDQIDWLERTYLRANLLDEELTPALLERPIVWPSRRKNLAKDVLLWPEDLAHLLPSDRYKEPAPLKHQCRIAIRGIIESLDKLPHGLDELGLPPPLRDYVQLYVYH